MCRFKKFFARSSVADATLFILQWTFLIAGPLSHNAVHKLEKRITCQATEVAINNACVTGASFYTNASTCTRSVPLACTYGIVTVRKCAAVNCTALPGMYLSTDAKECSPCTDLNAAKFPGYGLIKPFAAKQQPLKPVTPSSLKLEQPGTYLVYGSILQSLYFIGTSFNPASCTGQNGVLDQNLAKTIDQTAAVLVPGNCTLLATNPFVAANGAAAACQQFFIGPDVSC
ncbi:BQ2448_5555 [Microbotryum intermedium]|uniref:BQ2448_5555 protein n=1 Tax=Microbotryum intermedium TaxID=269621 RepID=A0A238F2H3_9BASI|nr:BQ2448_5555 [Microbotryum intermedium]